MWLSDIEEAISTFRRIFGNSCGWTEIKISWDGMIFSFKTNNVDGSYYLYYRPSHRIEKVWNDTWRTNQREVIYEGDF